MNKRHRRTLNAIFARTLSGNIKWRDVEALLKASGAVLKERSGSRVSVTLKGLIVVFHRPPKSKHGQGRSESAQRISRKGRNYAMIEYKGYLGVFEFDPGINLYHGTVINTYDMITFCGASIAELREEMQKSIEVYLEVCEEEGKAPDKPFSGTFEVQTSPALHCRLAWHAQRHHLDLNSYVQEVLEKTVSAG